MLTTERLFLRPFTMADLPGFATLIRDKMQGAYAAYDELLPTDEKGLAEFLAAIWNRYVSCLTMSIKPRRMCMAWTGSQSAIPP